MISSWDAMISAESGLNVWRLNQALIEVAPQSATSCSKVAPLLLRDHVAGLHKLSSVLEYMYLYIVRALE